MPGDFLLTGLDTMTRRRLLLIASLPLAVAVIAGVLAMLPLTVGVTKANFHRIEDGMTLEEVERIFGCPSNPEYTWKDDPRVVRQWLVSLDSGAAVEFRAERVCSKLWQDRPTVIDKFRRWLHLD